MKWEEVEKEGEGGGQEKEEEFKPRCHHLLFLRLGVTHHHLCEGEASPLPLTSSSSSSSSSSLPTLTHTSSSLFFMVFHSRKEVQINRTLCEIIMDKKYSHDCGTTSVWNLEYNASIYYVGSRRNLRLLSCDCCRQPLRACRGTT